MTGPLSEEELKAAKRGAVVITVLSLGALVFLLVGSFLSVL